MTILLTFVFTKKKDILGAWEAGFMFLNETTSD